ncbi:MAG: choice-of-anchor Q domain-containing protein, partial [Planctomycetota bacterium]
VWVEGDYHLLAGSPCINAGDPNYVAGANETDIDGQIRVWDGRIDMGADEFVPPVECRMRLTPRVLNLDSQGKWVKAQLVLPAGYTVSDVDTDAPLLIRPLGIESQHLNVIVNEDGQVEIKAAFDRAAFCSSGAFDGTITVEGQLVTGQPFYGTAGIKVIGKSWDIIALVASYWLRTDCGGPDWCGGLDLDQDSTVNLVDLARCQSCCVEVVVK